MSLHTSLDVQFMIDDHRITIDQFSCDFQSYITTILGIKENNVSYDNAKELICHWFYL